MTKIDQIQDLIDQVVQYQEHTVSELSKRLSFVQTSFSFSSVVSLAEQYARDFVVSESQDIISKLLGE